MATSLKTSAPHYGTAGMSASDCCEAAESVLKAGSGKATARYPNKPLTNKPGGGGSTSGSFKRALTPGTTPTGS